MSEVNFKVFGMSVAKGDLKTASEVLQTLLGISEDKAIQSTQHFQNLLQSDPSIIEQTMSIKLFIEDGEQNKALSAIIYIFNLTGSDSIVALEGFRKVIEEANKPLIH